MRCELCLEHRQSRGKCGAHVVRVEGCPLTHGNSPWLVGERMGASG